MGKPPFSPREYRRVFRLLLAAAGVFLVLAVLFALLWIFKPNAGENGEEALSSLREENSRLESLLEERETVPVSEEASSSEEPTMTEPETDPPTEPQTEPITEPATEPPTEPTTEPSPASRTDWIYTPGIIKPSDPGPLEYTLDLGDLYEKLSILQGEMDEVPFLVGPDGTLVRRDSISFPDGAEILYRELPGSETDADGIPLLRVIDYEAMGYSTPTIALAYLDLDRNTFYSYRGDEVFFSASLIKVPYVYTLLEQIAKVNEIRRNNPSNDPGIGETLPEEWLRFFDLERKIVLTEASKQEGSGPIRDMDLSKGVEFTVLELISYSIRYSDNTAFRVLRDEFGYEFFQEVSRQLGIESVFSSFNKLTVSEAVRYLQALYRFYESHPEEAGILIGLMRQANHTVLIPYALGQKNVAHKYGWDEESYHDMALVFGEAPYAVCIMTNFDLASNDPDVDLYLRNLIQSVDRMHESFYR
ncbi:MAG: serine hydrolase [Clostridia bacterium]|nr:serine hydrolase [Clostridia bacterium]